ncbi:MAG: hypothetical protein IJL67_12020 [Oscillospiraceae bacterium]|nr:hypothetical protein [Oscillospiraceae bacterium]
MKKKWMRMTALGLAAAFLVGGCSKSLPTIDEEVEVTESDKNVYDMIYFGEVSTLNYLETDTEVDYALCSNLVDSLVDYDRYGRIVPGLAESWS